MKIEEEENVLAAEKQLFLQKINLLADLMQLNIDEKPFFCKDVWEECKKSLKSLREAIETAPSEQDISHLIQVCYAIASKKEEMDVPSFLKPLYPWSTLPEQVFAVLEQFATDSTGNFSSKGVKNLSKKFKDSPDDAITDKDEVISELQIENQRLEITNKELSKACRDREILTGAYRRKNGELRQMLEELSEPKKKLENEGKLKSDENRLLRMQNELLTCENKSLKLKRPPMDLTSPSKANEGIREGERFYALWQQSKQHLTQFSTTILEKIDNVEKGLNTASKYSDTNNESDSDIDSVDIYGGP